MPLWRSLACTIWRGRGKVIVGGWVCVCAVLHCKCIAVYYLFVRLTKGSAVLCDWSLAVGNDLSGFQRFKKISAFACGDTVNCLDHGSSKCFQKVQSVRMEVKGEPHSDSTSDHTLAAHSSAIHLNSNMSSFVEWYKIKMIIVKI